MFRRSADVRIVLFGPTEKVRSGSRVETARRLAAQDISCEPESEWRAQGDDFRTFLSEFGASLPLIEFRRPD